MAVMGKGFCNIYGGEGSGPDDVVVLGGLGYQRTTRNWYCPNRIDGRFRMICPHGHSGKIMEICYDHFRQYENCVRFCPKCNANVGPEGHSCTPESCGGYVRIHHIS